MVDYTKYKLKGFDELASVLEGKDNLFVVACNKCFKEFVTVDEPERGVGTPTLFQHAFGPDTGLCGIFPGRL